ncbi:MAG: hypothetical protein Q9183_002045 [Haloplaca sp. 2 TL-2023]
MNHQDNIRIFTEGVEDARHDQRSRSHEVGPAVNLKLTVDLGKRNLYAIPDEVIEILRVDVERLQLAHNQICYIPDVFSQCRPLKYLNLRHNLFQDFPAPLFLLPQLEILDLSVNAILEIPEDIRRMRSLRVLSLTKNKIRNIPSCVKGLDTLRMLKLAGNPLRQELAEIVEAKDTHPPYDEATDNERETLKTSNLKQFLKLEAAARESGDGSSEGPLETPRPFMRNGSLRFPIKPNGSDYDSASEARSPGFAKPPIPARSHFRVTSGQNHMMQKSGLHRPGPAPLHLGNERNRSNSESVLLQGAPNNRSKRMGMIKKKNDLGTVEESQQKRSSYHLRGQSHASALRDWDHEGEVEHASNGNGHLHPLERPSEALHRPGTLTPHLTSTKRHRKGRSSTNFVASAKSVRYLLVTLGQSTHSLVGSLPNKSRQWYKTKDAQHEVTFSTDNLYHSVTELCHLPEGKTMNTPRQSKRKAISLSIHACQSTIARCVHLCNLLLEQSSQLLKDGERMYIRTLIWHIVGTSAELCHALYEYGRSSKRTTITQHRVKPKTLPVQLSHETLREEPLRDQSLTPTRERPITAKRVKNWNSPLQSSVPSVPSVHAPVKPTITTGQPSVPLYFNGRSRSNSRADQYSLPSSTDSTFPFSPAITPSTTINQHSIPSIPSTPLNRSRSSSVAAGRLTPANVHIDTDFGLAAHFDKIYKLLDETIAHAHRVLPTLEEHFRAAFNDALKDADRAVCETWSKRVRNCTIALDLSKNLFKRLQILRFQDSSSGSLRSSTHPEKAFWDLAKRFLASVGDLLMDVRAGYRERGLKHEVANLMRGISKASRSAGHEIADSPFIHLASPATVSGNASSGIGTAATSTATSPGAGPPPGSALGPGTAGTNYPHHHHHRQRKSSGSNSYSNVPATPLSAALGPAAQATVPSTPASGALERSFQGGWGERADTLLMMQQQQQQQQQQTMVHRR